MILELALQPTHHKEIERLKKTYKILAIARKDK